MLLKIIPWRNFLFRLVFKQIKISNQINACVWSESLLAGRRLTSYKGLSTRWRTIFGGGHFYPSVLPSLWDSDLDSGTIHSCFFQPLPDLFSFVSDHCPVGRSHTSKVSFFFPATCVMSFISAFSSKDHPRYKNKVLFSLSDLGAVPTSQSRLSRGHCRMLVSMDSDSLQDKHTEAHSDFAKAHLDKEQSFLLSNLWSDEMKTEMFRHEDVACVCQEKVKTFNLRKTGLAVKLCL